MRRRRRKERPPVKLAIVLSIDGGCDGGGDFMLLALLAVGKRYRERTGRRSSREGSKRKGSDHESWWCCLCKSR